VANNDGRRSKYARGACIRQCREQRSCATCTDRQDDTRPMRFEPQVTQVRLQIAVDYISRFKVQVRLGMYWDTMDCDAVHVEGDREERWKCACERSVILPTREHTRAVGIDLSSSNRLCCLVGSRHTESPVIDHSANPQQ